LKGQNGSVREFRGLLSFSSDYCIVTKPDAYALGYTETAHVGYIVRPPNLLTLAAPGGFVTGPLIRMAEATMGPVTVEDVEFVAFDLPQVSGVDVILGLSLLRFLKVQVDFLSKRLTIEKS
jgi:hypothetical protein